MKEEKCIEICRKIFKLEKFSHWDVIAFSRFWYYISQLWYFAACMLVTSRYLACNGNRCCLRGLSPPGAKIDTALRDSGRGNYNGRRFRIAVRECARGKSREREVGLDYFTSVRSETNCSDAVQRGGSELQFHKFEWRLPLPVMRSYCIIP